jgi:peroxiredoxin
VIEDSAGAAHPTAEEEIDADSAEKAADDIEGSFAPRPKDNIANVELEGEVVLLLEGARRTHSLNQTGTVVWKCYDGESTLDEISADLSDIFGADAATVREDVINVTRDIGKAGLLEGVAEELPHQHLPMTTPEGLALGSEIPAFVAEDLEGQSVGLEDLQGTRVLLINWSPACGFCKRIGPDLAEVQPHLKGKGVELVLLAIGDADANRDVLDEAGLNSKLWLHDGTTELFVGLGTPVAYLIDADGKIASELTIGANDVPTLARKTAGLGEEETE